MKKRTWIGLICSLLTLANSNGFCDFITFGDINRDIGNQGTIVEGDYQYTAVGASWSLQDGSSYPGAGTFPYGVSLVTFWGQPPSVGNVINFQQLNNSPFYFQSVELRGRLDGARNDVVMAYGFLNGTEVASQMFQCSNQVWRLDDANASFATPIDSLQLDVVESNGSTLIFDNLQLQAVPEPTTCVILALGLSALAYVRSHKGTHFQR